MSEIAKKNFLFDKNDKRLTYVGKYSDGRILPPFHTNENYVSVAYLILNYVQTNTFCLRVVAYELIWDNDKLW